MGIKGLTKLLKEKAPECLREQKIESYFGRKIAIDASMVLYQFLIAVRGSGSGAALTDASGEVTSHLIGLFYRTVRMISHGIKPVYVFDGKPPDFKSGELEKRRENREKAAEEHKAAAEAGDEARMAQMEKRLVKVGSVHCKDAQTLLDCLGVPWVQAAGEAEAQCAAMAEAGLVYAVATEDMDALTFRSPRLVRHMTYSEARKIAIQEYDYARMLEALKMTAAQFTDLCILCGCDYVPSIRGIGPKKAFDAIRKFETIEAVLENLDSSKYSVPDGFNFVRARELFKEPDVVATDSLELTWKEADSEATIAFLVDDKGFSKDRVETGLKRLKAAKTKSQQRRLDTFFKAAPSVCSTAVKKKAKKRALSEMKKSGTKGKSRKKVAKKRKTAGK